MQNSSEEEKKRGGKILVVCTANVNRSPTASWLIKLMNHEKEVWSRGSCQAACRIHGGTFCQNEDLQNADQIFCMEERNRKEILLINADCDDKITILDIEDKYKAFSKDLVMEIMVKLPQIK